MKEILEKLYQHKTFSKEEAKAILKAITEHKFNDAQLASFLTAFIMRNITLEELEGFREALLELCIPVDLKAFDPMDLCGTGGDGKNTFNISTLSSFVVAGSGIPVAKHGNYGVSSVSGSSNVLEAMGITFNNNENQLQEQIGKANICFLHAPLFHPALKAVGGVRKQLGVKTFFNILGPLVNPAHVNVQSTGVFNMEIGRLYHYLLQESSDRFSVIYALDGFDEISLTGKTKITRKQGEQLLAPQDFGFSQLAYKELAGGNTIEEAAHIFKNVLKNKGTEAQNQVVIANAATAIQTYKNCSLVEAKALAEESLYTGKAMHSFEILKSLS